MSPGEVSALRRRVVEALPRRLEADKKDALAERLVSLIKGWAADKRDIERSAEHYDEARRIGGRMQRAAKADADRLRRAGAERELRMAYIERATLTGVYPTRQAAAAEFDAKRPDRRVPLGGHSALLDLHLLQQRHQAELESWKECHAPRNGKPRSPNVWLAKRLIGACEVAGMKKNEIDTLLGFLSGFDGLPELNREAVEKQMKREKEKAGAAGAPARPKKSGPLRETRAASKIRRNAAPRTSH